MKGFLIGIKNDLLEKKHIEAMGSSVWFYMWCLDKMTSVSEEGIGKVLGGKPIIYTDIFNDLGIPKRTYLRWVSQLKKNGYIRVIRAPYGLCISVNKAVKFFAQRSAKIGKRYAIFGKRSTLNGTSNKTVQGQYKDIGKISQNELRNLVQ